MLNFKKKIIYRETYYINDSSIYRFEKKYTSIDRFKRIKALQATFKTDLIDKTRVSVNVTTEIITNHVLFGKSVTTSNSISDDKFKNKA